MGIVDINENMVMFPRLPKLFLVSEFNYITYTVTIGVLTLASMFSCEKQV